MQTGFYHNLRLLLTFSDDIVEVFIRVNSIKDCHFLQNDLTRLVSWAETLGLSSNISKCHYMKFTRIKNPLTFTHSINNNSIVSLSSVRDSGFILTLTFSSNLHDKNVYYKVLKTVGFIKRFASDFKLSTPLKDLYCPLVRPYTGV